MSEGWAFIIGLEYCLKLSTEQELGRHTMFKCVVIKLMSCICFLSILFLLYQIIYSRDKNAFPNIIVWIFFIH